jgi:hypothetical protein
LDDMVRVLGVPRPGWLDAARRAWAALPPATGPLGELRRSQAADQAADRAADQVVGPGGARQAVDRAADRAVGPGGARRAVDRAAGPGKARRALVPVWRRPWIWLGADTFAADVLRRLGVTVPQLGGDRSQRYPRLAVPAAIEQAQPDLVVLPDEPYRFSATDGPEAFDGLPAALVSGRHLTWYGPSLAAAPRLLSAALPPC